MATSSDVDANMFAHASSISVPRMQFEKVQIPVLRLPNLFFFLLPTSPNTFSWFSTQFLLYSSHSLLKPQAIITMKLFTLTILASIGTVMVSANPVPDTPVAGFGISRDWTAPVGYVCCNTIDKNGCHGCDFTKACPKDNVAKCANVSFLSLSPSKTFTNSTGSILLRFPSWCLPDRNQHLGH